MQRDRDQEYRSGRRPVRNDHAPLLELERAIARFRRNWMGGAGLLARLYARPRLERALGAVSALIAVELGRGLGWESPFIPGGDLMGQLDERKNRRLYLRWQLGMSYAASGRAEGVTNK